MKKTANKFKRVGLIGNTEKPAFRSLIQKAARLIAKSGRTVCSDAATEHFAGLDCRISSDMTSLTREVDLLVVFGGDGTMLQVAREIAGQRTPILGVNIGGLGFLTAASSKNLASTLSQVWNGDFTLESRALIEAGGRGFSHHALNDFVVSRGEVPRLIELEVYVNRQPLTRFRADGIIVSSPTGSTAYSLAAGGAIISPTAEVFELTPICAHTLSNRPLILDFDSTIQIKVISPRPATVLSGDGQALRELNQGDTVTISRSPHSVRLMHLAGGTFFDTLRAKLGWRGATL